MLLKQGKLDEALAAAQTAQKLDPKRFEAPATAALILHAARKPVEAKAALDEATKLAPPDKQDKVQKIAKLLATEPPAAAETTATAVATPAGPPQLTGAARRQLDALTLIIEEADKATLDTERKKLLQEFLDKSEPFVRDRPDMLPVWTLRAIAALELNKAKPAWEAGQQMIKLGAEDSDDARTRKVMATLARRGLLKDAPPPEPAVATQPLGSGSRTAAALQRKSPSAGSDPSPEAIEDWSGLFGPVNSRKPKGLGESR